MMTGLTFAAGAGQMILVVVYLAVVIAIVAAQWKVFEKAGKPGWASLVPIYNIIVLVEIVGKPMSWVILILFPCTMPIFIILAMIELAKVFGKDVGFGLGLVFLGFIFMPILGFGDAKYIGPQSAK